MADFDVVVGDGDNAPGLRPQAELVTQAPFPHEFLVELANHGLAVSQAQVVVAAIRDGAAGLVKDELNAGAGGAGVLRPVDGQE